MIEFEQNLLISKFVSSDIPDLVACFAKHGWPKSIDIFEQHLQEQKSGYREIWVASLAASRSDVVGIGVGLYGEPDGGYAAAQNFM